MIRKILQQRAPSFLQHWAEHHLPMKKKSHTALFFSSALAIGLIVALILFNMQERAVERNLEVTFLSPSQAVVFWTSPDPTIGFVRYGSTKNHRPHRADQTSSEPGLVHAVVINDVPEAGLFLSTHTSADSRFYWPEVVHITFDPTTIE